MKILVTGGAGYIGSVLVPMLLQHEHEVRVLDNFQYGDNSLASWTPFNTLDMHRVDVRDESAVRKHTGWPDVVIPLAALVGAPICERNPVDANLLNLQAPIALLDMLSQDQYVVMPTTESVYGAKDGVCTEETPVNPLSLYGKHKAMVEEVLLKRKASASLRLATVFGMSPRMRLDLLINDFTWRALKERSLVVFEAHYRRTSVHVRDVAATFLHCIEELLTGVYNVGSIHTTKLELCQSIQKHVPWFSYVVVGNPPKDAVGRDPDQRNYQVSDAKILASGFSPQWSLDDGIAELLRGYRSLSNVRHSNVS